VSQTVQVCKTCPKHSSFQTAPLKGNHKPTERANGDGKEMWPGMFLFLVIRPLSGRIQACPRVSMTDFFFPHTVPCVRLLSDNWLLWGKLKGKVVALNFPYGF